MYYSGWEFEKWDALRDFIREKDKPSIEYDRSAKFEDKYEEMNEEIKKIKKKYKDGRKELKEDDKEYIQNQKEEQEEINKKMKAFFSNDMQTYVTETKDSVKRVESAKDAEIDKLKAQLSSVVSEGPKLWEYLSLRRRRLVTINSKIEDLKTGEDKENYPKNVLIYLMALTRTSLFWVRQWFKRDWMNLTRRWQSDNIQKNLQIIKEKLEITEKDSPWTRWLKMQLQQHLLDAKKAYVDKQKQSVGLA